MEFTRNEWLGHAIKRATRKLAVLVLTTGMLCVAWMGRASASVTTTTVQGTVYLANGEPGTGMLHVSWPAFTSVNGQSVVADSTDVTIGQDGFLSVNLAPNLGAMPGGLYYTAVFYMSDGSVSTQYWVVPAAAQTTLAQVQAQVMPAAQAVQAVNKAYVDQAISQLGQTMLSGSGGTLTGPLYLSGDPAQPLQAADKHYVDSLLGQAGSSSVNPGNPGQIAYYSDNGTSLNGMSTIPVTAGGTGSTTSDSALKKLRGVSSAATSAQAMAGPLVTSLTDKGGQVFNVVAYGAVGDCNSSGSNAGCTDNTSAIQAAINAAYAVNGVVYFPVSSAGGIYYVANTLNPKGVSLIGTKYGENSIVSAAIRGAPGKDIFAPGDPASGSYVKPRDGYTVQDLLLLVDDSVDASASFPNRLPGRTTHDASTSSGSAVLTSANADFQPGDVGQHVRVYGAGAAGANLDTTIASWQSLTQVTLTATASTGVSGAHLYIAVADMPVTQTVGNCAWAYDNATYNHVYQSTGSFKPSFIRVTTDTLSRAMQNNSCGYFWQGNSAVYGGVWDHSTIFGTVYGFVATQANLNDGTAGVDETGIGDHNDFRSMRDDSKYEWITYGGGENSFSDFQSCGSYGPHILLGIAGSALIPVSWSLDWSEMEGCPSQMISLRVAGHNHTSPRLSSGKSSGSSVAQWDASDSMIDNWQANESTINLAGSGNVIKIPFYNNATPTIHTTGVANQVITTNSSGPFDGVHPAKQQFDGERAIQFASGFGSPSLARQGIAFNRSSDFVQKGASAYYFNNDDLWIWPQEWLGSGCMIPYVPDTTSETGVAAQAIPGGCIIYGSNTEIWYFGRQFPVGKQRFYVKAKAASGTGAWSIQLASNASGYTTLCTIAPTLTTSYQVFSCDGDSTGMNGNQVFVTVGAPPGGNTVSIAWVAVRPWDSDAVISKLNGNSPTTTIASGSLALATSAITSGCQTVTAGSVNSAAATGVLTTDTVTFTPNGSIKGVTGYTPGTSGGLTITAYPTAGYVNFDVCNWSGSSITPGAVTLNWKVTR